MDARREEKEDNTATKALEASSDPGPASRRVSLLHANVPQESKPAEHICGNATRTSIYRLLAKIEVSKVG